MANHTAIQWCDGTVNPVAGCNGCELFETREHVIVRIAKMLAGKRKASDSDVAEPKLKDGATQSHLTEDHND